MTKQLPPETNDAIDHHLLAGESETMQRLRNNPLLAGVLERLGDGVPASDIVNFFRR